MYGVYEVYRITINHGISFGMIGHICLVVFPEIQFYGP